MSGVRRDMKCSEARETLLEADVAQLEGRGGDALAEHLRGCDRCRSMARMILDAGRDLGDAIDALVPAPSLDDLLARAERGGNGGRSALFRQLRWSVSRLVPLAAAAALVALFLGREPALPGDPMIPQAPAPAQGLGLEFPSGQDVAVLATNNPDITVLWFF